MENTNIREVNIDARDKKLELLLTKTLKTKTHQDRWWYNF